jgi:hypothetical protein
MSRVTMRDVVDRVNAGELGPEGVEEKVRTCSDDAAQLTHALTKWIVGYYLEHPGLDEDAIFAAILKLTAAMSKKVYGMTPEDFATIAGETAREAT